MKVTIDLPDELAADLQVYENQSADIVAAGLREIKTTDSTRFPGLMHVLEKLAELPSPEQVLALRPSPELDARIRELLQRNRDVTLTREEETEWQSYELLEHLVRMAKARARAKLNT